MSLRSLMLVPGGIFLEACHIPFFIDCYQPCAPLDITTESVLLPIISCCHKFSLQGSGWKVVASFEGNFPNRIKQLPLDKHFDINNVKRIVLEADGYQPYLISPEKGLRSLIKIVLELAKEPSRLCVDEVHRVLVDIVSAAANATPGLGRYPPFKREVVAIASTALEGFKNEAKKMVVALVDMERAFVPPQHFIRLVQRRYAKC
ncbi:Dynamin-2A [Vitis vinifera]|uniref:Dynamin-2A n=1 Tax=Vitis vinifera TaxID=29760 RepID=A0A438E9Q8_VITVI|nr:Dynamin-2A [Vitis vinifera]